MWGLRSSLTGGRMYDIRIDVSLVLFPLSPGGVLGATMDDLSVQIDISTGSDSPPFCPTRRINIRYRHWATYPG